MSEQDLFLLSDTHGDFVEQISQPTENLSFNEKESFSIITANGKKCILDRTDTLPQHYKPVTNGIQQRNTSTDGFTSETSGHTNGKSHCAERTDENNFTSEEEQDTNTSVTLELSKLESDTYNASRDSAKVCGTTDTIGDDLLTANTIKLEDVSVDIDPHSTAGTHDDVHRRLKEISKQFRYNCVMCDSHFVDLIQLETHVKSHNEVLHFSILLKKVGEQNEERTRNVISSLIELAKSSDFNLNKFGNLLRSDTNTPKRKYTSVKRSRKSKPRKTELVVDAGEEVWDNTLEDEPADNENEDPTYAADNAELESNSVREMPKRLSKRLQTDRDTNQEPDIEDNDMEIDNENTAENEPCTKETENEDWKVIEGSEFRLVKKEGRGRPAHGANCPVCAKFITGRAKLKLHMKKEHNVFKSSNLGAAPNVKSHTCEVCGLKVKTLQKLRVHLLQKHQVNMSSNAKMYKCLLCDSFFGRRSELKEHRTEAHPGESEHICNVCGKMLSSASLLEKHLRNHTGEKPFKCDICPKAFALNTKFQEHIRQHTGERPFVCDICGAKFNRSCNKKRHMLIHEGKFPHTCEICGKGFRDIGPLTLHIRRHNGDKPYKCEDANCNMAFITRGELECHRAKHTQKREHLCSLCGAEFLYKGDLRRHAKLHTGERPYKCADCNAAFTRNQHLKHHWQSHHANGARAHKEWKPRKKPGQFGLPKQSSLLTTQSSPGDLPVPASSDMQQQQQQQVGRFHQPQPQHQHQPHQEQQHQQQQVCVVCNQWFPSEAALKAHSIIHTMDNDQMFLNMATACRQDYNPITGVQLNNLSVPVPGSVEVCTLCNILITEPGTLHLHMQNVHGQYP